MLETINIDEEKIAVEIKEFNLMNTLIAIIFTILAITFFIIGRINNELIIYKVLASFSMILAIVFYVIASLKSKVYANISFDKDYFIFKEYGNEQKIPTAKIIEFKLGSSELNYYTKLFIIVRYIGDYNEPEELSIELKEVNEKFVETANKRLRKYRKEANIEVEEDRVAEFFEMLEEEEELEVIFIGRVKPGIIKDDILKDLLFVTEDYVPLLFSSKHSFIDFNNIKEYKKYWIREAAFGGGEYVFTDSEDTSDRIDVIKINEIRRKLERKGSRVTNDVEELKKNTKNYEKDEGDE